MTLGLYGMGAAESQLPARAARPTFREMTCRTSRVLISLARDPAASLPPTFSWLTTPRSLCKTSCLLFFSIVTLCRSLLCCNNAASLGTRSRRELRFCAKRHVPKTSMKRYTDVTAVLYLRASSRAVQHLQIQETLFYTPDLLSCITHYRFGPCTSRGLVWNGPS